MNEPTLALLDRQKQQFISSFEQLNEQLFNTSQQLTSCYDQALQQLDSGKYIVNTSLIKELRMYLAQITKVVTLAGNGVNLFLLAMNSLHQQEMAPQLDIEQYVEKYRDKTELPLRRGQLEDRQLSRIRSRCTAVSSVLLQSNALKIQDIFIDQDLSKLKVFSKISRLSIKGSNISDVGLQRVIQDLQNLKQIDISQCRMIGNQGVKRLSGYKFVSIKLNRTESISQRAILGLISTSYNLNYLEIGGLKQIDERQLLQQISEVYAHNKLNFKWLQLVCGMGTVLFVNKLAYLTHLTNADSITDRQVQVLIGEQSSVDGLYFNCCDELHSDTINFIISRCSKLKRLSLRRFVNLTDVLVGDIVSTLVRLEYIDFTDCCELTSRALIQTANQLRKLKEINLSRCVVITDQGVIYLAQKMPSLIAINLSYCKAITDTAIYHICNLLPALKSINLQKCQHLTDDSIIYLSQKLSLLECLVLSIFELIYIFASTSLIILYRLLP